MFVKYKFILTQKFGSYVKFNKNELKKFFSKKKKTESVLTPKMVKK